MKHKLYKKRYLFGAVYGITLAFAAGYVLLDTFVIPDTITQNVTYNESIYGENLNTADSDSSQQVTASTTDATITANSYSDNNISISITQETAYDTQVYIVDVQISNIAYLKTAFANNTFGRNIKEATSDIAESSNAILAINGDYYGFRNKGYVIRNGVLYRDTSNNSTDLAIMTDGSFRVIDEDEVSASKLIEDGALQVLSFGPALLEEGEVVVGKNEEVSKAKTSNPRTAIGIISPLHYVFVVSDGRTDESAGLTLYQLADVFEEMGCETAYNLDGGGSSTLWFNGEVINNPTDGRSISEREVSDIVYIGY